MSGLYTAWQCTTVRPRLRRHTLWRALQCCYMHMRERKRERKTVNLLQFGVNRAVVRSAVAETFSEKTIFFLNETKTLLKQFLWRKKTVPERQSKIELFRIFLIPCLSPLSLEFFLPQFRCSFQTLTKNNVESIAFWQTAKQQRRQF